MAIVVNIYYTGKNGAAKAFMKEMLDSGIVEKIKAEKGNLMYDYFLPEKDEETVLLIDKWQSQEALDIHHLSPMMAQIAKLREKYDLKMKVEKYISDEDNITENDKKYIRQ